MPKFTLICEHSDVYGNPNEKMTHEFTKEYLPEVLENIEMFLRGSGYVMDGLLDIVPVDDYELPHETGTDNPIDFPVGKSQHYFDTERNK